MYANRQKASLAQLIWVSVYYREKLFFLLLVKDDLELLNV